MAQIKGWNKFTDKEKKFVASFLESGNATQSYFDAGYSAPSRPRARQEAMRLKRQPHIQKYLTEFIEKRDREMIADGEEVLEYLTKVMRGEVKDAFGLDVTVSERTRAAVELAKRTVDISNKMKDDSDISISLKWD